MTTPQYGSVQPVQFPLSTYCTGPCWAGGSGVVTVVNQDTKNYAYIGYTNSIAPGGLNTAPLGPGASMTFPGDRSLYAVGITSSMSPLLLMPGAIQYSPPQTTTASIFTSGGIPGPGTPALVLPNTTPTTLVNLIDVTQFNSYDINLYCYRTTVSTSDALTVEFSFIWYDDLTSGIPVFQEDWWVWVGGAKITSSTGIDFNPLAGNGPMHGRYLTVQAYSPSTASNVFVQWLNIYGSPRTVPYSDWRQNPQNMSLNIPARTIYPNPTPTTPEFGYENTLAIYPSSTPGGGGTTFYAIPLPLYAGPVAIYWDIATAVTVNTSTLISCAGMRVSDLAAGTAGGGTFQPLSNTLNTPTDQVVNFPRAPCMVLFNPAATSVISFAAIGQQAA